MAVTRPTPQSAAAFFSLGLCLACSDGAAPAPEPAAGPAPTTDAPPTAAPTAFDCTAPAPPTPRCPPESSPSCAQLWEDAEGWRAACGQPDGDPEPPGPGAGKP